MMKKVKTFLVFLFGLTSVSALSYQISDGFYPIFPIAGVVVSIGFTLLILYSGENLHTPHILAILILIALLYRLGIFYLSPSLLGVDAVKHSVQGQWIRETGTISILAEGFYRRAPIFQISLAQVSIVTDLRSDRALIFVPILIGTIVPLVTAMFIRDSDLVKSTTETVAIGGLLAITGVATNWFSIAPVAQILTLPLLFLSIISISKIRQTADRRYLLIMITLLIGMIFTHKLPNLVLTFCLGTLLIFGVVYRRELDYRIFKLMLLSGSLLLAQWIYVTDFFQNAVFLGVTTLDSIRSGRTGIGSSPSPSSNAVSAHPDLTAALLNKIHLIIILVAFFAALIICANLFRNYDIGAETILAGIAPLSLLVALGTFTPLMGGSIRYLLYAETLLAITVAIGISLILHNHASSLSSDSVRSGIKILAFCTLVLVVTAQFGGSLSTPDKPDTPRMYLTSDEVEGKQFQSTYISETVYSDRYYAKFVVDPLVPINRGETGALSGSSPGAMSDELRNATIVEQGYDYVSVRNNVDIYRLENARWYRLTWNQNKYLSASYNRIYDNGNVTSYERVGGKMTKRTKQDVYAAL
ncbi:hypothetical protein ACM16X_09045 [Haloarcula japonica]|uniref:hypothetical protein n=1 Tax=Haloarcula japonica TaxID=29282 RepID=UPI0039F6521B